MSVESGVTSPATVAALPAASTEVYADGVRAGLVGSAAIALWFLVLDVLWGRPFFTPAVLGTALFEGSGALATPEALSISLETVVAFTFVHVLVFLIFGVLAARLLELAERDAHFGFGIVLLFVVFEAGFIVACAAFAEPVLQALAWPAVVIGNLLAAAAMGVSLRRRHPKLAIAP
jgi:hypothetical protein